MQRAPRRTVPSFQVLTPQLSRFTFGSMGVVGIPDDVQHYVRRRRSSALTADSV